MDDPKTAKDPAKLAEAKMIVLMLNDPKVAKATFEELEAHLLETNAREVQAMRRFFLGFFAVGAVALAAYYMFFQNLTTTQELFHFSSVLNVRVMITLRTERAHTRRTRGRRGRGASHAGVAGGAHALARAQEGIANGRTQVASRACAARGRGRRAVSTGAAGAGSPG